MDLGKQQALIIRLELQWILLVTFTLLTSIIIVFERLLQVG
jgi:hypothetical protein